MHAVVVTATIHELVPPPEGHQYGRLGGGQGGEVLAAYAALETLLQQTAYGAADQRHILALLETLGLLSGDESQWAFLRRSRGQLLRRPRGGPVEVIAGGRSDWIGWLELKRESVNEAATRNTARVMADLKADVLAVIEAEDRPALDRFNRDVFPLGFAANETKPWSYRHVMLVDGNDDRGIDVGLLTRTRFPIERVRSHVDDRDSNGNAIFSRDCAEYEVAVPGSDPLLLLVNHFKSKGYGGQKASNAKRLQQARRAAKIYSARRDEGWQRVAVLGDLNDTPDSKPLKPLVKQTDLRDVSEHPSFDHDGRTGTYGTGSDKIDYLLLSPALFVAVEAAGLNRKAFGGGRASRTRGRCSTRLRATSTKPPTMPRFGPTSNSDQAGSRRAASDQGEASCSPGVDDWRRAASRGTP